MGSGNSAGCGVRHPNPNADLLGDLGQVKSFHALRFSQLSNRATVSIKGEDERVCEASKELLSYKQTATRM